ncbi:MAG: rhomboid family intramembrane serine protease [Anaerolineae bacterium]|nr:rhomboid family intramembrane serine protease [Anaerolineae bacterium]NIN96528.1 rhomboid family intramembrane serine protease [Anaerolineae bacterium]NIQ79557.1 rhomboid family intramembrane serine protease [Anaerolineae bacterium]
MIPLGDSVRSGRTPFVNYALIALTVIVFFLELVWGPTAEELIYSWGAVPADLVQWRQHPWVLITLVTSIFLHGGWFHLIGNMLYLVIFGDNVEGIMGHKRYLAFYLGCGVTAGVAQVLMAPTSVIPGVGASGAIAGVLAAYLLCFPRARVFVGIPLLIYMQVIALPAVIVLGFWFVFQLLNGVATIAMSSEAMLGGVAWWAHIGGFIAGLILTPFLRRRRRRGFRYLDAVDSRYLRR